MRYFNNLDNIIIRTILHSYKNNHFTISMETTDIYTNRRLLYKCDTSIAKIYGSIMKMMAQPSIDEPLK